jgi:hypothetical protein
MDLEKHKVPTRPKGEKRSADVARDARRLAQADAETLIRDHGAEAYREARQRERDVLLAERHDSRWPDAGRRPRSSRPV